jgi:hypothetical protein
LNPKIDIYTIEPLGSHCPLDNVNKLPRGKGGPHTSKQNTEKDKFGENKRKTRKLYEINTLEHENNNKK